MKPVLITIIIVDLSDKIPSDNYVNTTIEKEIISFILVFKSLKNFIY